MYLGKNVLFILIERRQKHLYNIFHTLITLAPSSDQKNKTCDIFFRKIYQQGQRNIKLSKRGKQKRRN